VIDTAACDRLQSIPGIGPSIEKDLVDLGYSRVVDLREADPESIYEGLCRIRGTRVDRCLLYVFRCAVYYASNPARDPERHKWWHWKDKDRPCAR